ncbi:MAG: polysaccharide biosynthesis tyrosine autokinase [Candidatus Tumulicola sp.]
MSTHTVTDAEPHSVVRSLTQPFLRHRNIFIAIVLGFFALVVGLTIFVPKTYTAQAKLIAGSNGSPTAGTPVQQNDVTSIPVLNALLAGSGVQSAETYAELFQQLPVAQQVAKNLGLQIDTQDLLTHVKVVPVNDTTILTVSATWGSAAEAARIANEFSNVFVARERDLITSQATSAMAFLSQQLPGAEKRLRVAQTKLAQFEATNRIADVSTQTTNTVNAAAAIDAKINQTELDQQQASAQIATLGAQLKTMSPTSTNGQSVSPNPVLAQLQSQLAQLQVQLHTAQSQYTDQHPTVVNLKNQIADTQQAISRQPQTIVANANTIANPVYQQLTQQRSVARAQVSGDKAQLGQLHSQRRGIDPLLAALPAETAALANLQRQEKLAEQVYTALQQKYNDATVTKTTALSDVTITQPATAEDAIPNPNVKLNLLIGAILALILGTSGVFLINFFDNSIKDERDVEEGLSLPVLATIPRLPGPHGANSENSEYLVGEAFLQLVTAMRYSSDKKLRTIAITSPLKGDGKSTIAVHMAKALGELGKSTKLALPRAVNDPEPATPRVLLIDADLRRPSLHLKLGLPNARGLSDVLVGETLLSDAVQPTRHPNVDLLCSGTMSPNPINLLQSEQFDALLDEAKSTYATVILDAPATVPVYDGPLIASKVDGTIFVVSSGSTDIRSTKKALQRLAHVGVRDFLGTVINRSPQKLADYSDYFAGNSVSAGGNARALSGADKAQP